MKIITTLLTVLSLVSLGTATKCYLCNSEFNHESCKDVFNEKNALSVDCGPKVTASMIKTRIDLPPTIGKIETQCMKLEIPVNETVMYYERTCTYKISGYEECERYKALYGTGVVCNTCTEDLCNFGSTTMASVFLTIACIFFKYFI